MDWRVDTKKVIASVKRVRVAFGLLLIVLAIFLVRLFYVQVINFGHYRQAAAADQVKKYEIPATRGIILAHQGSSVVPIVLNNQLYTIYADPVYVKDANKVAAAVAQDLGGKPADYVGELTAKNTRYVVLKKRVEKSAKDKLLAKKIPGIGAQAQDYRTYPNGSMAAQLLGFVDDSGKGQYGLEQALNKELAGTPGRVKAVTDINGVPLAASPDNVSIQPKDGSNVTLTIDTGMQQAMEATLKKEYKATRSQGLSAVIIDANNGHVKAMANYPSYNPADYQNVKDIGVFKNGAVDHAIEPGSSMKILTAAAALDQGVVTPTTSFYDPAHWIVDGFNITDIEEDGGAREQNVQSILSLSLNTGATWELMQMGEPGGTTINAKGIKAWHEYMASHFLFGEPTGIEQGYESAGFVPPADMSNPSIKLRYANTSFGQGVQITALQEAAAVASVVNGGTYYQPTLVSSITNPADGRVDVNQLKIKEKDVVSASVSRDMVPLLQNVVKKYHSEGFNFLNFSQNYMVGGKTGTAQVAKPTGGYYKDIYNGTYAGFVGGNKPEYVIVVFNIKPGVSGYAGSFAAMPVFADLAHMLIDKGYVSPKD